MVERILIVKARLGLHARAAAKLVRVASRFESQLRLERLDDTASADAKSILSVLMLAASRGTELRVIADGVDEHNAIKAVDDLFSDSFGEAESGSKN